MFVESGVRGAGCDKRINAPDRRRDGATWKAPVALARAWPRLPRQAPDAWWSGPCRVQDSLVRPIGASMRLMPLGLAVGAAQNASNVESPW